MYSKEYRGIFFSYDNDDKKMLRLPESDNRKLREMSVTTEEKIVNYLYSVGLMLAFLWLSRPI